MDKISKINLSEQNEFRLDEISKTDKYFIEEINQWKLYSKKLNKYITTFDYIDKILIIINVTTWGVSIISFANAIGAPVGIANACFTLIFSLTTRIVKKLLDITRKKKKKNDKILMLAKSKLNSIDTLISQALIDMTISHEEFITVLKEKDRYEIMKGNLENKDGESYEIIRFNSVKSKT